MSANKHNPGLLSKHIRIYGMILILFFQQILSVSAQVGTAYNNPQGTTNESWIGDFNKKGKTQSPPQETLVSDESWILPGKNKGGVNPVGSNGGNGRSVGNGGNISTGNNPGKGNTVGTGTKPGNKDTTVSLNSAPNNPGNTNSVNPGSNTTNPNSGIFVPITNTVPSGYTTPNGTPITSLTNSYVAPAPVINYATLSSFSVLGPLTYSNVSGVFGISVASSTSTGVLTSTDWNTFNGKEDALTFTNGLVRVGNSISLSSGGNGEVLTMSGGVPTWIVPSVVSIPVLSVFGRTGAIVGNTGDYTTSLVLEGDNLYYTQARFDAAFGLKTTDNLAEGITNLYFTNVRAQNALSGTVAIINANIAGATGSIATVVGNINTLSGNINTLVGDIATMSGGIANTNTNFDTLSGVVTNQANSISMIYGDILTATGNITTLSGNLATTAGNVNSLSGTVDTLSGRVNVTETNISSLSGTVSTTNSDLTTLSGVVANQANSIGTIENNILTATGDIATLSGNVNTLSGNLATLSGVVATKISLGSLSVLGPLTYNNVSGVFGINIANSTTTGALSATDWNIFNNKIGSINGLTGVTQLFAVGNTGTDFNIVSTGNTHTFNIPDASGTARGLVSTGAQTFTGTKTFANAPTFSSMTAGSLLFAGVGGSVSQDNSNFFWDNTNKRLGIGTNVPGTKLQIQTTNTGDILRVNSGSMNIFRVQTDTDLALDTAKVTIGSGNTAKPEGLARDQLYVYGRINSSWDDFRCDFLNPQQTIAGDSYAVCGGLGYDVTTGGSLAAVSLAGISGSNRLSTTAVAANYASALSSMGQLKTERSLNPVFEARVIVNTTTARSAVGFTDMALGGRILTDTNNSNNEIFFRKTAAGTFWETVTRSAAGVETVNVTTATTANMRALRIEVNDLAGKVFFYIDGNLVATHTTGIPLANIRLGFWTGLTSSVAAVSTMDIDYIKFWSDDPDTAPQNNTNIVTPVSIDFDTLKGNDVLPEVVWDTRSIFKEMNYIYDRTASGKTTKPSADINAENMTLDEYALYASNTIKRSIEKFSGEYIDSNFNIDSIDSNKINTKNICIDGVCISSGQVNTLLESNEEIHQKINALSSSSNTVVNNYTTQVINTITETGSVNDKIEGIKQTLSGISKINIGTIDELKKLQITMYENARSSLLYIKNLIQNGISIIQDLVVLQITALQGYFDEIWAERIQTKELLASGATIDTFSSKNIDTEQICLKKSNGQKICINADQLEKLIDTPSTIIETSTSQNTNTNESTVSGEIDGNIEPEKTTITEEKNTELSIPTNIEQEGENTAIQTSEEITQTEVNETISTSNIDTEINVIE